ncbi:hypothetical protein [Streptomyces varsoviensis]|uniref:hypothetical protein n=1 Tax=Streptomyces varsoviensis TaxID=67373 RepID=UPI0004CB3CDF|nr:hypothetical protein [Streptomyces varsoviensis]
MVTDRLAQAVRQQLGLGRVLPLGGPADGAWITERAASGVLRRAADALPGVRLGRLRVAARDSGPAADPSAPSVPPVPPPPSALPPGPLRIEADFAATADQPLPTTAGLLRDALRAAAVDRLGLTVDTVDLHITSLLDGGGDTGTAAAGGADENAEPTGPSADTAFPPGGARTETAAIEDAALSVPGVTRLAPALGGPAAHAVRTEPADRHVQLQLAVSADHRALTAALAARDAVAAAASSPDGPVTVAVLVTAIDDDAEV